MGQKNSVEANYQKCIHNCNPDGKEIMDTCANNGQDYDMCSLLCAKAFKQPDLEPAFVGKCSDEEKSKIPDEIKQKLVDLISDKK